MKGKLAEILRRRSSRRGAALCLAVFLGCWLVYSVASFAMVNQPRAYSIPSRSMAPALQAGDRVAVQTTPQAPPKRGEIWVFHMPKGAGASGEAVKRVIGLPGETVEVANGRVLINGQAIDEPYLAAPATYAMPPLTLRDGEYLMLGDSRDASNDGHVWGPLPSEFLVGPVIGRIWPLGRMGGL